MEGPLFRGGKGEEQVGQRSRSSQGSECRTRPVGTSRPREQESQRKDLGPGQIGVLHGSTVSNINHLVRGGGRRESTQSPKTPGLRVVGSPVVHPWTTVRRGLSLQHSLGTEDRTYPTDGGTVSGVVTAILPSGPHTKKKEGTDWVK